MPRSPRCAGYWAVVVRVAVWTCTCRRLGLTQSPGRTDHPRELGAACAPRVSTTPRTGCSPGGRLTDGPVRPDAPAPGLPDGVHSPCQRWPRSSDDPRLASGRLDRRCTCRPDVHRGQLSLAKQLARAFCRPFSWIESNSRLSGSAAPATHSLGRTVRRAVYDYLDTRTFRCWAATGEPAPILVSLMRIWTVFRDGANLWSSIPVVNSHRGEGSTY